MPEYNFVAADTTYHLYTAHARRTAIYLDNISDSALIRFGYSNEDTAKGKRIQPSDGVELLLWEHDPVDVGLWIRCDATGANLQHEETIVSEERGRLLIGRFKGLAIPFI